jgi:hypothetical protein
VLKLIHAFFVFVTHVFKPHQDIYCTTSSFHLYFTSTSIFTFVFFFYFTFLPYFAITSSSTSVPMHAYPPNFSYCTALHCTALHCTALSRCRFAALTSLGYQLSLKNAKKKKFNSPLTENILLVGICLMSLYYTVALFFIFPI